jgi:hypothetical protein
MGALWAVLILLGTGLAIIGLGVMLDKRDSAIERDPRPIKPPRWTVSPELTRLCATIAGIGLIGFGGLALLTVAHGGFGSVETSVLCFSVGGCLLAHARSAARS